MAKRPHEDDDDEVEDIPQSINPYKVLSVTKDASSDDIKKAYRKAALKHHPDKASPSDAETAKVKFQEIAFAYAILSDERRRKRYDLTGNTSESLDLDDDSFDWTTFYREQYADIVTTEAVEKFAQSYKNSDEERCDLLKSYTQRKGDMKKIYEEVMLSDMLEDEDRFRGIIDAAIESGEVEAFKKYTDESESARRKRMEKARKEKEDEAEEAEEALKEIEEKKKKSKSSSSSKKAKASDIGDLAALIQQRQKGREQEDFFAHLEAKYAPKGGKAGKKGKGKQMDEPPEEAFERNAKRSKK